MRHKSTLSVMGKATITFFVLGLISILMGANGVGGLSLDNAKMWLFIFLILSVTSFIGDMVIGKNK